MHKELLRGRVIFENRILKLLERIAIETGMPFSRAQVEMQRQIVAFHWNRFLKA